MEARVRKAEKRYQTLVEHIPVVTFLVSFENRKSEIYVSPFVEKLLGYTAKEWVDDPILWYQRLYTEDRTVGTPNSPAPLRWPRRSGAITGSSPRTAALSGFMVK